MAIIMTRIRHVKQVKQGGVGGVTSPNLLSSRKTLRQLESQTCMEKPVSYIAFFKRLEFSDCHSCLPLSDCHS